MTTPPPFADVRVPIPTSTSSRSAAIAVAGVFSISTLCGFVGQDVLHDSAAYGSPGAAAIALIGVLAVIVATVRGVPPMREHATRPVPRKHMVLLLLGCIAAAGSALLLPAWRQVATGALTTVCIVTVYLACWGFRALFLLRRVSVFSLLTWPVVAERVHQAIDAALTGPSDLVFRRLAALGVADADDHPWRTLSAMDARGAIAVTTAVVLVAAGTRLRISVPVIARFLAGASVAMVAHHALVLTAPLESYSPSWWASAAPSPLVELAVGVVVAIALFRMTAHLPRDEQSTAPSPDRDPAIFGSHGLALASRAVRVCALVAPTALMAAALVAT